MNYENIIREIKKKVPFKEEEFELFAQKLSLIHLKKKEVWEAEGKVSQHMGFVNKGILREYFIKNGDEFTNRFYMEGDFAGNYISRMKNEPSQTITLAVEPCELLVMPFEDLVNFSMQIPSVAQFSQIIANQKIVELNERNSSLLLDSPEERYYKLVDQQPDLLNRIPQYLIAQYLGIRPESLSRIRKRHNS